MADASAPFRSWRYSRTVRLPSTDSAKEGGRGTAWDRVLFEDAVKYVVVSSNSVTADQVTTLRLRRETLALLDRMADKLEVDRSTLLRRSVDRGAKAVLLDEAISQYLRGDLSAGAASEWSGVSYVEFIDELRHRGLPFLVDSKGIHDELAEFNARVKKRGNGHR